VCGMRSSARAPAHYQDNVLDLVFEQDQRVVELNARTLAKVALDFKIPVILSTVGVEIGVNGPTIPSLRAVLSGVRDIDRSSMNAWEDAAFLAAVKAAGRNRLVMAGIVMSRNPAGRGRRVADGTDKARSEHRDGAIPRDLTKRSRAE
jgi:hypothetical protein